jgi:hypothetical protein
MAAAADDINRLRRALSGAGIVADDATIFDAWSRHSDEHAASWLSLYHSDADNLKALLKQVDLDEPPSGSTG